MAGIAGIVGRIDPGNRDALARMLTAMARGGATSPEIWSSAPNGAGLGCMIAGTELATSDDRDTSGRTVVVADATIFNGPELQNELAGRGETFDAAGGVAGVALRMLARDGAGAAARLRGMFALAMWSDARQQLLLARDPLGHRPLYVCQNPNPAGQWSWAFASELRALLASKLIEKPRLDPIGVASVIWNGFVMSPGTMVAGVESLLPGQMRLIHCDGSKSDQFFWTMPAHDDAKITDEQPMRQALRECVRLHMRSDAPLGVFLSGGIDSGSIANLAQQHSGQPIQTYCLATEEAALDESAAAREIARAIGSEHHDVLLTEQQFVANLDAAIDSLDQPTFDAMNQYHICRAVRDAGMGAALGGIGGDAIFGGDATLDRLPRMQRLARAGAWLPESFRVAGMKLVARMMQKSSGPIGPQTKWAKLPDVARAGGDLLALYQLTYAMFLPGFQHELMSRDALDVIEASSMRHGLPAVTRQWLDGELRGHTPIEIAAILETRCFVGERLLRDAHMVSSGLGMELRSPLADVCLIEQLNRLPDERKYLPVGYKPLLRKYGLEGLDPKLFDRPKSGFVLPFARWLGKNLGATMESVMLDSSLASASGLNGQAVTRLWQAYQQGAPGLYWTRPWNVYVLIRWCHHNGVLL